MKMVFSSIFQRRRPVFPRWILFFFLIVLILFLAGAIGYEKIKNEKPSPASTTKQTAAAVSTPAPLYNDFYLVIPALDVSAPVIADVDGSDKTAYFKALQSGVAHFSGTAKPGEGSNIFIFGHSSFYAWDPGKYKEIFAHLGDMKKGDEISLWWQGKEYKYKVTKIAEVSPDDVDVLKPTASEQLTLMTCWPPGTTAKRLIVVAVPQ